MNKYVINYHTGAGNIELTTDDLNEVKAQAKDGLNYTQQHVSIEDADGNIITQADWVGVEPTEDDTPYVLEQFGSYGYYQLWSDELENM